MLLNKFKIMKSNIRN